MHTQSKATFQANKSSNFSREKLIDQTPNGVRENYNAVVFAATVTDCVTLSCWQVSQM